MKEENLGHKPHTFVLDILLSLTPISVRLKCYQKVYLSQVIISSRMVKKYEYSQCYPKSTFIIEVCNSYTETFSDNSV